VEKTVYCTITNQSVDCPQICERKRGGGTTERASERANDGVMQSALGHPTLIIIRKPRNKPAEPTQRQRETRPFLHFMKGFNTSKKVWRKNKTVPLRQPTGVSNGSGWKSGRKPGPHGKDEGRASSERANGGWELSPCPSNRPTPRSSLPIRELEADSKYNIRSKQVKKKKTRMKHALCMDACTLFLVSLPANLSTVSFASPITPVGCFFHEAVALEYEDEVEAE